MASPSSSSTHVVTAAGGIDPSPGPATTGWKRLPMAKLGSLVKMSDEAVDEMIAEFANHDEYVDKTWTRRIVENFLLQRRWYFPKKSGPNAPTLSKAYAYYEHITLPRHYSGEQTADHILRRAEPGDRSQSTELYSPFFTPSTSLIEWGSGIDLYFSTVRIMAVILFMAGIFHLPNAIFYSSSDYSPTSKTSLPISLRGSAVCPTVEWVACLDCTRAQWTTLEERDRFGTAQDGTVLVAVNNCAGGQLREGMVNYACFFFLMVIMGLVALYLRARQIRFDEDKITPADYSILVNNPPPDAYDPDEWRDFFEQFADKQVTFVTVALDNQVLVRKLCQRRVYRNKLRLTLPKGTDMDDEDLLRSAAARIVQEDESERKGCFTRCFRCTVLPILRLFGMFLPADILVDRVFQLTEEIKELQKEKYHVTKVFVTFETEEGQRAALSSLSVGTIDILLNRKSKLAPSAVFRNTVLDIREPTEPSAVRWLFLSTTVLERFVRRMITLLVTLGMVSAAGTAVGYVRFYVSPGLAGPMVAAFNSSIPQLIKWLMILEPHTSEGSFQTSLYLKITIFRWFNTAFLTKVITPFTSTLAFGSSDVLPQIRNVLLSDLWLTPALRLLDLWGNVKKHYLAPRERTQELMNLHFQGTPYNLGERYTDLTKVLFVCFFYSALYPTSFFFGAAILIVQYYADKYCLMRIWGSTPFIGNELAAFSRRYFFSGAMVAYIIINSYAWAQFPYDNVCSPTETRTGAARTYANILFANGTLVKELNVERDDFVVGCGQNWESFYGLVFPPTSRVQPPSSTWMSDSQAHLTDIYGWTALAIFVGFIVIYFGDSLMSFSLSWFSGVYKAVGQIQHIDFSSVEENYAYVPQIKLPVFLFPLIACDVDQIDQGLIGWNDPAQSYDYHNLIFDVPWEGMPRTRVIKGNTRNKPLISDQSQYQLDSSRVQRAASSTPIFSIVKHYPPPWMEKLRKQDKDYNSIQPEQE